MQGLIIEFKKNYFTEEMKVYRYIFKCSLHFYSKNKYFHCRMVKIYPFFYFKNKKNVGDIGDIYKIKING